MSIYEERLVPQDASIFSEVTFPGYTFTATLTVAGFEIRATYMDIDVDTGEQALQVTRAWPISATSSKSQFIRTMFKCVLTSKEHYTREHFLYKGRAIFGPHIPVDVLWDHSDPDHEEQI